MRPYLFQKMPRVECLGHESPDDVHGKPDICVLRSFPRKQRKEGCQNRHGRPARIDGNGRVGYKLHGQQDKPTGRSRKGKKMLARLYHICSKIFSTRKATATEWPRCWIALPNAVRHTRLGNPLPEKGTRHWCHFALPFKLIRIISFSCCLCCQAIAVAR